MHDWPVVVRPHDSLAVLADDAQLPDAQRYAVTVRERVPVLSQVLVKPPHAPHAPYAVEAHARPSVALLHARVSVVVTILHAPARHRGDSTARCSLP